MPFAHGTPGLRHPGSRYVHRYGLDCQYVGFARPGDGSDVYPFLAEHASYGAEQVSVDPDLGPVVDTVQLQPNSASLVVCRDIEPAAPPGGVEVASGHGDVGNASVVETVVEAVVWFWKQLVVNHSVEYSSGYYRLHPSAIVISGTRNGFASVAYIGNGGHFPLGIAVMEGFRVQSGRLCRSGCRT